MADYGNMNLPVNEFRKHSAVTVTVVTCDCRVMTTQACASALNSPLTSYTMSRTSYDRQVC